MSFDDIFQCKVGGAYKGIGGGGERFTMKDEVFRSSDLSTFKVKEYYPTNKLGTSGWEIYNTVSHPGTSIEYCHYGDGPSAPTWYYGSVGSGPLSIPSPGRGVNTALSSASIEAMVNVFPLFSAVFRGKTSSVIDSKDYKFSASHPTTTKVRFQDDFTSIFRRDPITNPKLGPNYGNDSYRGKGVEIFVYTMSRLYYPSIAMAYPDGTTEEPYHSLSEMVVTFMDFDLMYAARDSGVPFEQLENNKNPLAFSSAANTLTPACVVLKEEKKLMAQHVFKTSMVRAREIHTCGISTKFDKVAYQPNSTQTITASDLGLRPDQTLEDYIGVKKVGGKWCITYCVRKSYLQHEAVGSPSQIPLGSIASKEVFESIFDTGEVRYIEILNDDLLQKMDRLYLKAHLANRCVLINVPSAGGAYTYTRPDARQFMLLTRRT